jgi:hypothetical protein
VADPVSWFVIENGWTVVDRDGDEIGKVESVLGDEERDIFDGLAVATKLIGRPRYIPSERVAAIVDGRVQVDLSPDDVAHLAPHEPAA